MATRQFLEANCYDCHVGNDAEAGLDLKELADQLTREIPTVGFGFSTGLHDHEMPPADYGDLDKQRENFLSLDSRLDPSVQQSEFDNLGRVKARRLTNLQLERTLHDLLGIDIPLASRMPDEPRTGGFTTIADGQAMSHFQLAQHVDVVDAVLDEAFRRALTPDDEWTKVLSAKQIVRQNPRSRTREPEMLDEHAVVWSGKLVFYGRIPATTAKHDGWYRFKIRAKGLKVPEDRKIWCTIRSGHCTSGAPLMAWVGAFEVDENYNEVTVEAWIPKDQMLEIRPGDLTLKQAKFRGGQVGSGEGGPQDVPGVAIDSIEMERMHQGPDNNSIRNFLFGDLRVTTATSRRNSGELESESPKSDLERLMLTFAERAFRRPISQSVLQPYISLAQDSLDQGNDFASAIRMGYRAILCSPRFMYFQEQPGRLDDYAIASRLSYLIWNRMPDHELLQLAAEKKLGGTQVLQQQVERMLADRRGKDFVCDLSDQWLDLSLIDFTEPDSKLYPGFDVIVQDSMLDETHAFLQKMLDDDLSVTHLIDADFTFLNSRLARFYGIDGVEGDEMRQVSLDGDRRYGGLLTQGSIMKVTANGTTTSPVIRGVWVSERLLGQPIPPPPQNVPAIEPDIRGATTIREMLAKHKENGDCAACHRKIDPPGFALENFDPSGRWRDSYVRKDDGEKTKLPIDTSFEMPDGKTFENIDGFKQLVLDNQRQLARNVVEKLVVYGTGASVQFADRNEIELCLNQAAESGYGFRSLLKAVLTSKIFLTK